MKTKKLLKRAKNKNLAHTCVKGINKGKGWFRYSVAERKNNKKVEEESL